MEQLLPEIKLTMRKKEQSKDVMLSKLRSKPAKWENMCELIGNQNLKRSMEGLTMTSAAVETIKCWIGKSTITDTVVLFCMAYQYRLCPDEPTSSFFKLLGQKLAIQRNGYQVNSLFVISSLMDQKEVLCYREVEMVAGDMREVKVIDPDQKVEIRGVLPPLINSMGYKNMLAIKPCHDDTNLINEDEEEDNGNNF